MLDFQQAFARRGVAGQTSAPMSVEDVPPGAPPYASGPLANPPPPAPTPGTRAIEGDLPPGAPDYAAGPLANPPVPSPTPAPQSLTTLANGGMNHAEAWMAGQAAPSTVSQQHAFNSAEPDLPPGAPPYAGGPLANPKPTPKPNANFVQRFSWSGQTY